MTVAPPEFLRMLVERAATRYRRAGKFAWHFAQGKLGGDPAFAALLSQGLLTGRDRIVDIGCGQGLLAAWVLAAEDAAREGQWPAQWPAAPRPAHIHGIDLLRRDVIRAEEALSGELSSGRVSFVTGDMCHADFGRVDAVVILDVLHYVREEAQEDVLRRVRAALDPGGVLVLRIGDAAAGLPFRFSNWVDHGVAAFRGNGLSRFHCRTLTQWQRVLSSLGFTVQARAMSAGTPFANVMLVARL